MLPDEVVVMIPIEDGLLFVHATGQSPGARVHLPRLAPREGEDHFDCALRAIEEQTGEQVDEGSLRLLKFDYDHQANRNIVLVAAALATGTRASPERGTKTIVVRHPVQTNCIPTNRAVADYFR